MKTVSTLKEYQEVVDEVKKSKQPVKVKVNMSHDEIDRAPKELNLEGVEVIVSAEFDEIKAI
jgi:hypothetical protein